MHFAIVFSSVQREVKLEIDISEQKQVCFLVVFCNGTRQVIVFAYVRNAKDLVPIASNMFVECQLVFLMLPHHSCFVGSNNRCQHFGSFELLMLDLPFQAREDPNKDSKG